MNSNTPCMLSEADLSRVSVDADFILDLYETTKQMKPEEQPESIEFLKDLTSYLEKNFPLQ